MIGKGIRGALQGHRRRATSQADRRRSWPTATDELPALRQEPDRRAAGQDHGVRRRGQGRRRRQGQGAVPGRPHLLGADRAGRGDLRRPRPEDRRPRGRRRGGHGVHRLPPAREGPVGRPALQSESGADRRQAAGRRQGDRRPRPRPRSSPRCSSPTAPRSCSTRSPPARSPARRTATRTPTCGTSTPTWRAPRPPSRRCARCSRSATPTLVKTLDDAVRRRSTPRSTSTATATAGSSHRAVRGRAQGAVRRDQRAGRADQQGRRGGRAEVTEQSRRAARSRAAGCSASARRRVAARRRRRRRGAARSPAPATPTATAGAPAAAGAGAVPRRAPGRHRHAGPGPAALRRVRRRSPRTAPSCVELLQGLDRARPRG